MPERPLACDRQLGPRRTALEDGVSVDQQLSGASGEGKLVGLSLGNKSLVEGDECGVPAERGGESGGVERASRPTAAAGDVALALMLSTVVVEGRQPGQCGGFFSADVTEFGHAQDERQCGTLADAGD